MIRKLIIKMGTPIIKLSDDEYYKISPLFWISSGENIDFSIDMAIRSGKNGLYIED